ncbi:hypothetical protein OIDMADRAFT_149679 [Oidiodendron maius Zn]|uniref:Uncharacterized protein n=1 Tax=Oidiodendron maius (strain Zn) TaxID=913774 RepID=A0A0C3GR22_OIDMZ|nr:hypothetical protein OIDMADRAFT_149679 [Oidiodendron maius Zn]
MILEDRQVCSGVTGETNTERYGAKAAEEVAAFQPAHIYALKQVMEHEKINCDFILIRTLEVLFDQAQTDSLDAIYHEKLRSCVGMLDDVGFIGQKYAEQLSGIKEAKAAFSTTTAQLWPY